MGIEKRLNFAKGKHIPKPIPAPLKFVSTIDLNFRAILFPFFVFGFFWDLTSESRGEELDPSLIRSCRQQIVESETASLQKWKSCIFYGF